MDTWNFEDVDHMEPISIENHDYTIVAFRMDNEESEFKVDDGAGGYRHVAYNQHGVLVMNKPTFL